MTEQPKELSDNSMLGYISTWFATKETPKGVGSDLKIYTQAVSMLNQGVLSPEMFVMISQGVISRIKRDSTCRELMNQYLKKLGE